MLKKTIRLAMVWIILIFSSSCAGGIKIAPEHLETTASPLAGQKLISPPNWVLGKEHKKYSLSQYIVGVGFSGSNSVSANESARLELAKSLKVKIKSKIKDYSFNRQTQISSTIESEVNAILEGVEIKDGWYDNLKSIYYSFATLKREIAATGIRLRIKEMESSLKTDLKEGQQAEIDRNAINALSKYFSGFEKISKISSLRNALRVVLQDNLKEDSLQSKSFSQSQFLGKVNNLVHNLKLNIVSGDKQVVKNQSSPLKPLIGEIYLKKEGVKIPLEGIPLLFEIEKGNVQSESKTISNHDGRFQTLIHTVDTFKKKNHVVTAKLDYDTFLSNFDATLHKQLLPLKNIKILFNYHLDIPQWSSEKSQAWKRGITNLVNQAIKNIPPDRNPVIGVTRFKNLRHDKSHSFNAIIKEDFETVLVQAQNLTVKETPESIKNSQEIAKEKNLDFFINGSYRLEKKGLEIRVKLVETKTSHILSSGNILIKRNEINLEDLEFLTDSENDSFPPKETYLENLEKLLASKPESPQFNIQVWTDKMEYQIGEDITFHVKSDKDAYLTLLNVGSNGDITVLFPNAYHKDNFLIADKTHQIPNKDYSFKFKLQGPAGLERVKAIATLNKELPLKLDLDQGFHTINRETSKGSQDIKILANEFSKKRHSNWAEASSEVYIFERNKVYYRGSRKIPIVKKPEKPKDILGTLGRENSKKE